MLNSFWGKFGENLDKTSVTSIDTPAALFQLLTDPVSTVHAVRICSEDVLEVVHSTIKSDLLDNGKTNIFVAAFTTCLARLKLYKSLEALGEQVLYYDTDSVIYRCKPGEQTIPTENYLDEMTDELEGKCFITEFVSGGPKNYGYLTSQGDVCCKVRGFTLNVRGKQHLNYDVMKNNVISEVTNPLDNPRSTTVPNPNFFTRHSATKRIKIVQRDKKYSLVFDKRVVDPKTFKTYPYGYSSYLDDIDQANVDNLLNL